MLGLYRFLLKLSRQLGAGFPRIRVERKHRIKYLNSQYKHRMCNIHDPCFPKSIEVRSRKEVPPPTVGSLLEIDDMVPATVLQVGGFQDLRSWEQFPYWGKGGVGLDSPASIHAISSLSPKAFAAGDVWWAVLKFE